MRENSRSLFNRIAEHSLGRLYFLSRTTRCAFDHTLSRTAHKCRRKKSQRKNNGLDQAAVPYFAPSRPARCVVPSSGSRVRATAVRCPTRVRPPPDGARGRHGARRSAVPSRRRASPSAPRLLRDPLGAVAAAPSRHSITSRRPSRCSTKSPTNAPSEGRSYPQAVQGGSAAHVRPRTGSADSLKRTGGAPPKETNEAGSGKTRPIHGHTCENRRPSLRRVRP